MSADLAELIERIPVGWTRHRIGDRNWGISRTDRADGRVITVFGEELGGRARISANVWRTRDGWVLRPCEMPAEDVLGILRSLRGGAGHGLSTVNPTDSQARPPSLAQRSEKAATGR